MIKSSILMLCLLLLAVLSVQSCKSQKETARDMTRDEKAQTMVAEKSEQSKAVNPQMLQNMTLEKTKQKLLGTWNWYKTDCCARLPKVTYAKDVEETKSLHFSQDNIQTYYENGEAASTVQYEVGNAFNDDRVTLKSGEFKTAIVHLKGDTLVLDYGYMDLAIDYYIKATSK